MKVLIVLVATLAACSANYGGHYSGPLASPVVNPNGFLADTPEVAAAKAAHFSEVAKAGSPAPAPYAAPAYNHYSAPAAPAYNPAPAYNHYAAAAPAVHGYNGASVTPQGFLADTPDVAAAKAAHFAEVAKSKSSPSYGPEDDGSYRPEYDDPNYGKAPAAPAYPQQYSAAPAPAYNHYSAPAAPAYNPAPAPAYNHYSQPQPQQYAAHGSSHYTGPLAKPVVTPQGFLAETPEVAAAKAAHFAEFAKAGSPSHYRRRRSTVLVQTPASTTPLAVYSAPAVAYSAPALAYSTPAVAYSTPAVYSAPAPVAYSAPAHAYAYPYSYPVSGYSYSVSSY